MHLVLRRLRHLKRVIEFILLSIRVFSGRKHRKRLSATRELLIGILSGGSPRVSWAQNAEDLVLADLLPEKGMYVDVGAHHPFRYSVTKVLYERGWRGVNIDITEAIKTSFPHHRPLDHNVYTLVSDTLEPLTLHRFRDPALNTVSDQQAETWSSRGFSIEHREVLVPKRLDGILNDIYGDTEIQIDLLCVDVEGHDLKVLRSLDLDAFRVATILVELPSRNENELRELEHFLKSNSFRQVSIFAASALYMRTPDSVIEDF